MARPELRGFTAQNIEVRAKDDGTKAVDGYAVKWDEMSLPLGSWYTFREKIAKGAFSDSLSEDDQRALWSHDTSKVLGRTKNNTLRLTEDNVGLRFELDLPNTTLGNDAYESIKRGDIDGVSFGFTADVVEWDESNPDEVVRTVKKAKLFEISPVAFPAYEGVSEVQARSLDDEYKKYKEEREAEKEPFFNTQNYKLRHELKQKLF